MPPRPTNPDPPPFTTKEEGKVALLLDSLVIWLDRQLAGGRQSPGWLAEMACACWSPLTMSSLFFPHKTLLCVLFAQLRQRKKMFSGRLGILGREARVAAPVDGAHCWSVLTLEQYTVIFVGPNTWCIGVYSTILLVVCLIEDVFDRMAAFSFPKFLGNFTIIISSIKNKLIIKLITWMDGKSRGESIKTN